MAEAYSIELRERVIRAYLAGEGGAPTIAARFKVGEATVKRWLWRHRDLGHVRPTKKAGGTPSKIERSEIDGLVAELGDANAGEITAAYNRHRRGAARLHVSTIKRALHRFGYVVKKNGDGRSKYCAPTLSRNERRS
jgi:transposase